MAKKKPAKKFKPAQPQQPLWDWTKGLTQSAISQFLQCREQFALNYIDGWTSKGFSVPLEFGTVIHLAVERWAALVTDPQNRKTPTDVICEITEAYAQSRSHKLVREAVAVMSKTLAAAEAVFPEYAQYVAADDKKQTWVAHEQLFEVKYTFEDNDGNEREVLLRGCRDGAYRHGKKNLGLFETKTRSQIDANQIKAALRADLQSMFYLTTMGLEYGQQPTQILYNIIRRPGQKFLDRDNYRSFKDRITKDIQSRPSYYFARFEVEVQPEDIQTFRERVLDPALRQMIHWWEDVMERPFVNERFRAKSHSLNLNALLTKYGLCPLYELIVLGNQHNYEKRSSPFPELVRDR